MRAERVTFQQRQRRLAGFKITSSLLLFATLHLYFFLPSLIAQVPSLYFNFQNNLAALPVLFPFLNDCISYISTVLLVVQAGQFQNHSQEGIEQLNCDHTHGCPVPDTARSKIPQTLLLDISRPTTTTTTTATMPTTSVPDKTRSAFIDSHVVDD